LYVGAYSDYTGCAGKSGDPIDRTDCNHGSESLVASVSDGAGGFARRVFSAALGQCEIVCAETGV
jgi:hypothetical protein